MTQSKGQRERGTSTVTGGQQEEEVYIYGDIAPGMINNSLDKLSHMNDLGAAKHELIILKKKFEDSESNIIHELYT